MTALDLLTKLRSCGVAIEANGDRLKIDAPKGVITPELREALATNKTEIIALLIEDCPSIKPHDESQIESEKVSSLIPEPLPVDVIDYCYNGPCGALLEFKQGRAYCPRCSVYQRIVA